MKRTNLAQGVTGMVLIVVGALADGVNGTAMEEEVALSARPDTYVVRASGLLMGKDYSRSVGDSVFPVKFPLAHVRVDLYNSNNDVGHLGDDWMGSGRTDEHGFFLVEGRGKDWWQDGKPDVYARVSLEDGRAVRITNVLGWEWTDCTPEHDNDNVEGDVWLGTFWFGTDPGGGGSCEGLYQGARLACKEYLSLGLGDLPYGRYTITQLASWPYWQPWTTLDTTRWPTNYENSDIIFHEFGHTLRHTFDAPNNNVAHFLSDAGVYGYARFHTRTDKTNLGFAFNEGWAEFWEGFRSYTVRFGPPAPLDMEVEGDVEFELQRLSRLTIVKDGKPQAVGRAGMVEVLRDNPGTIHSFADFERAFDTKYPSAMRPRASIVPSAIARQRMEMENAERSWAESERGRGAAPAGVSPEQRVKAARDRAKASIATWTQRKVDLGKQAKDIEGGLQAASKNAKEYYDRKVRAITLRVNAALYEDAARALEAQMAIEPGPEAWKQLTDEKSLAQEREALEARRGHAFRLNRRGLEEMIEALKPLANSPDSGDKEFAGHERTRLEQIIKDLEKQPPLLPEMLDEGEKGRKQVE